MIQVKLLVFREFEWVQCWHNAKWQLRAGADLPLATAIIIDE